ncbi:MAG: aspartate 1-decarboxylase [Candidatus Omnitrophica bacterium CG11_big_fil_rev_8_21_14_0_20_42_13]|uniref:Aspartate 1-decarboxylase n=1 Tax=Candidatus Ghiorseimicrobium undicola TaxID=1974746 RepID=A0A2H0LVE4_9BACT|nr:MAG: aspartate 1-decarboxylase [Candidatus Omnitrophica bacterium CG11_big_fil_rev_8_21_14_0_20_42_13]
MFRTMLKSKIHKAQVTQAELQYEGSITIDNVILKAADIYPHEKVEVLNLNNGQRIETYAIVGKENSGIICLNGPAARFACVGDEVIILGYVNVSESDAKALKPKIVYLNKSNKIEKIK